MRRFSKPTRLHAAEEAEPPATLNASLERYLRNYFRAHLPELPPAGLHERMVKLIEQPLLILALEATGGNQCKAAEILGINRNTLRRKMETLGLVEQRPAAAAKRPLAKARAR